MGVCGPTWVKIVDITISFWMQSPMLKTKVKVLKRVEQNSNCISRVTARQGDVVFWDRATMMAHRDDPFLTNESRMAWVGTMMDRDLPNLIEAKAMVVEESKKRAGAYNRNRVKAH